MNHSVVSVSVWLLIIRCLVCQYVTHITHTQAQVLAHTHTHTQAGTHTHTHAGTRTHTHTHTQTSQRPLFVPGVWGPYYSAMLPGHFLNEGGQSTAGQLVSTITIIEYHNNNKCKTTTPGY